MGQDILEEDMGIHLDLGNMALLEFHPDDRVLHNADDASAMSFRFAVGAEQIQFDNQKNAEVHGMGQATIITQERIMTMSGADSV
jgi:hypothetical protein